jgi:NACHT domain-containing protein
LKDFITRYARDQAEIRDLIDTKTGVALAPLLSTIDTLKDAMKHEDYQTRQEVTDIRRHKETRKIGQMRSDQLIHSLWFDSINARRTQIQDRYCETFEWVYRANDEDPRSRIRQWMNSEEPLLWISGKAGSGKSTLMKYIVRDERTIEQLNQLSGAYKVYSYFIWNSGALIQRNLKGMYCSLLYGMLRHDARLSALLLEAQPGLDTKRSPLDWELDELSTALTHTLRDHHEPACIFIDGLDELDNSETPFDLINIFRNLLSAITKLKLCVSSRPEPLWKSQFENYPYVRVQDLTEEDMRTVAQEKLKDYNSLISASPASESSVNLIESLVIKAQGVFLWLHLAVNSLLRGMSVNDDWKTLQMRIDDLPSDLSLMYKRMWDRLGDDGKIYTQRAALYFNIVLTWAQLAVDFHELRSFHLAVACSEKLQEDIFREKEEFVRSPAFEKECIRTNLQIEHQSGGLLEVSHRHTNQHNGVTKRFGQEVSKEVPDPRYSKVGFVHRTAKDFLCNTADGRILMEQCTLDRSDIICLLVKAVICNIMVRGAQLFSERWFINYTDWYEWPWCSILSEKQIIAAQTTCKLLFALQSNPKRWEQESMGLFKLLKEAFERDYAGDFHETMASFGFIQPVKEFLESYSAPRSKMKRIRCYLLWHYLEANHLQEPQFYSWLASQEQHLDWAIVVSVYINGEELYQMLTLLDMALLRAIRQVLQSVVSSKPGNTLAFPLLNDSSMTNIQRKYRNIFVPYTITSPISLNSMFSSAISKSFLDRAKRTISFDEVQDSMQIWVEFFIETNMSQVFCEAVTGSAGSSKETMTDLPILNCPKGKDLMEMLHKSDTGIRRVILMSVTLGDCNHHRSVRNATRNCFHTGFHAVPDNRSAQLLRILDAAQGRHRKNGHDDEVDNAGFLQSRLVELLVLQELIMIENKEPVDDISNWLRSRGYFIPTSDDIKTFRSLKSFDARFDLMDDLNRRRHAIDRTQMLCIPTNGARRRS